MNTINTNLDDEIMCSCSGTTRGEIQSLFKEGLDIDAISRRTGALSGCAGCEWDIAQFLKALADATE
ncbi:MAG TPA: (2Fe-2S)-binding protein [Methylotenera sp.]|nr:(2Fe-2S)-binding protein [Methylotenera sp.]HPV43897.1 (2Fe-2S)-binding protein [Methylotenera sp.]